MFSAADSSTGGGISSYVLPSALLGFPSSGKEPGISVAISPRALMVKVLQNYCRPFHGELKGFLILLAHHMHCYLAGKDMSPGKPQQRPIDISSRREESNASGTLISNKTASSHRHLYPFLALGIHLIQICLALQTAF